MGLGFQLYWFRVVDCGGLGALGFRAVLVGGGVVKGFGPKDLGWFRVWGGFKSRLGARLRCCGILQGFRGADMESMESTNGSSQHRRRSNCRPSSQQAL